MKKAQEELILNLESIREHVDSNAECLKRLMMIVSNHFPFINNEVSNLFKEWVSINKSINDDLSKKIKEANNE